MMDVLHMGAFGLLTHLVILIVLVDIQSLSLSIVLSEIMVLDTIYDQSSSDFRLRGFDRNIKMVIKPIPM